MVAADRDELAEDGLDDDHPDSHLCGLPRLTLPARPGHTASSVTSTSRLDTTTRTRRGTLTLTSGAAMSNTTNICAKCHTTTAWATTTRTAILAITADEACIACHTKTPHAWKRPRLIGYTSDPVPYRSTQVTSITREELQPGSGPAAWTVTDCGAAVARQPTPRSRAPILLAVATSAVVIQAVSRFERWHRLDSIRISDALSIVGPELRLPL